MSTATGFKSEAWASSPSRSALPPGAVAELAVTAWLGGTWQEAAE